MPERPQAFGEAERDMPGLAVHPVPLQAEADHGEAPGRQGRAHAASPQA